MSVYEMNGICDEELEYMNVEVLDVRESERGEERAEPVLVDEFDVESRFGEAQSVVRMVQERQQGAVYRALKSEAGVWFCVRGQRWVFDREVFVTVGVPGFNPAKDWSELTGQERTAWLDRPRMVMVWLERENVDGVWVRDPAPRMLWTLPRDQTSSSDSWEPALFGSDGEPFSSFRRDVTGFCKCRSETDAFHMIGQVLRRNASFVSDADREEAELQMLADRTEAAAQVDESF